MWLSIKDPHVRTLKNGMIYQDFLIKLEHNINVLQKDLAGDLQENNAFTLCLHKPLPVSHYVVRQLQDEEDNSASSSEYHTTQPVDQPSLTESNSNTSMCELSIPGLDNTKP